MYGILRTIFFWFPPEPVHRFSMTMFRLMASIGFIRRIMRKIFLPKNTKPIEVCGLTFRNAVGLGAGFDKNASYLRELDTLGFGFVEIGTVTPLPQPGNEKPRVFRLPKDKGLVNRMGFNNEGVEVVAARLKKWKAGCESLVASRQSLVNTSAAVDSGLKTNDYRLIIGGNIGKNKITPNEDAWTDYVKCFLALHEWVDYFTVNVSSPNTPGLRELQEKDSLRKILVSLQEENKKIPQPRPIFLKIAPDLTKEQLDDVVSLAKEISLDGLVATNTTISREGLTTAPEKIKKIGAGGLSGKPVQAKSTEVQKYLCTSLEGKIPVMASGGIFTGADAREKMEAGACLVQVWTGFIYVGPLIVKKIYKSF
ncbi:MAG: dihydroorotate dehydrogenase (quinone) [Chitinophagaceae bacterium]|nr:dihydroorotate dehydrogenase (quinone) [Chitinophagaceae bacterium]